MMRNFVITTLFLIGMGAQAQVPHWTLHPKYDSIEMLGNGFYVFPTMVSLV